MLPFNSQQQGMQKNPMQTQPNMGIMNPQIPNPFNTNMNNGPSLPLQHQIFAACPNNMMNFPNNHLGVPQYNAFGSGNIPIANMGFPLQNNGSQGNLLANMCLPQVNGNLGFPNGQFIGQGAMSMAGSGQVGGFGVGAGFNQLGLGVGNQNPGVFGNSPFGVLQPNQQGMVMPGVGGNMINQLGIGGQMSQRNWPRPANSESFVGPQQSQNMQSPNIFTPQGNNINSNGNNNMNPNWKKFPGRNFKRNTNGEASHEGFKKPQHHHANNAKRKFGTFNENNQKGFGKEKAVKFGHANSTNLARERKRLVMYSEQEIRKWREERKKNYPSNSNIEKKVSRKFTESEASLRREQLKEILAKQAELGVEVAEIPSHYLNSDKRVHETKNNTRQFTKKGKLQNKFDKRGRHNKRGRFLKKQNFENKDSNVPSMNTRKPSLLEKLLSADIKRDKSHLLQVFRFMVMNSCFKDWPEQPLKYPEVIVREDGSEGDNIDGKMVTVPGDISEENINTRDQNTVDDGNKDYDNDSPSGNDDTDEEETEVNLKEPSSGSCSVGVRKETVNPKDEEGEIID